VSDHGDAPDPRTDIADLYAFVAPGNGDRTVLVLNINSGASAPEARFDPAASYELKIDTDGDLEADVAFHVLFASSQAAGALPPCTGRLERRPGEPVRSATS
jgi:hypothetical protein